MIKFKKYSSIENSFTREFMDRIERELPSDLEWVVQEKVHGANISFLFDGEELRFAKRTSLLEADEKFYDFQKIMERFRLKIEALYNRVCEQWPETESISLFGELFGGRYDHSSVAAVKGVSMIQKGIYYAPGNEFYAFDIYLHQQDGGGYLSVDEANLLFEEVGFFYARTLFRGSLEECLEYPNAFESRIAGWLGLPPIADNICEGVVIRPVVPQYLANGSRVLIKNKNARFAEKKGVKARNKEFNDAVTYSEGLQGLIAEIEAYVTENRLANVLSHIGPVSLPKDFGKVVGMFSKDVLEDFLKEHGESYSALEKGEQKCLTRELNGLATALVKKGLSE